jgi:hypothetical protein
MTSTATAPPPSALTVLFGTAEGTAVPPATLPAAASVKLRRALKRLPPPARAIAVQEVREAAAGLLDINLVDLLLEGWRQYRDLTSAAQRTLASPGSSEVVRLATHRVTVEQKPQVSVQVDGAQAATIEFGVSVVLDITALLATIRAGLLETVHAGRCDISVTLAIDGVDVTTKQARLDLPGAIECTPGIRLLAAASYAAEAEGPPTAVVPRPAQPPLQPAARPSVARTTTGPAAEWWEQ